jgi:ABC-type dipeptide/oligopeptide/nickel transport system ATPase subunit
VTPSLEFDRVAKIRHPDTGRIAVETRTSRRMGKFIYQRQTHAVNQSIRRSTQPRRTVDESIAVGGQLLRHYRHAVDLYILRPVCDDGPADD